MAEIEENVTDANHLRGSRRKFTEEYDAALMKEVIAHSAHVVRRGEAGFDEVETSLNDTEVLPWRTDGKYCSNRFHLLVRVFRQSDAHQRRTRGQEEEYTEKYRLLPDIVTSLDDENEERRARQAEASRRDEQLRNAGEEVRVEAMNRRRQTLLLLRMNDSNSEDGVQEDDRDDLCPRSGSSIESLRRQKRKRDGFGDD
jgi:hypothetical protein